MIPTLFNGLLYLGAGTTGDAKCDTRTGAYCDTGLPNVNASGVQLHQILAIIFGVLAAISVVMIVIAGLHYITSQGNPQETAKARDTILFALIGLLVAIFAEAIVIFVLRKV